MSAKRDFLFALYDLSNGKSGQLFDEDTIMGIGAFVTGSLLDRLRNEHLILLSPQRRGDYYAISDAGLEYVDDYRERQENLANSKRDNRVMIWLMIVTLVATFASLIVSIAK